MRITGISGSASRMAEVSRRWANHNMLWESTGKLPNPASAPPHGQSQLSQPQLSLHNPQKGAAWLFRNPAVRRPVAEVRVGQRSPRRKTVDERSATVSVAGTTDGITGVTEGITGVTQSAAGAIDIAIRARNERAAFFLKLERHGIPAKLQDTGPDTRQLQQRKVKIDATDILS